MSVLQYNSYELSPDSFNKLCCAMCLTNGDMVDALNFCVECESYFCSPCLKNHLNSKKSTDKLNGYMQESSFRNNVTEKLGKSNQALLRRHDTESSKRTNTKTTIIQNTRSPNKTICTKLHSVLMSKKRELTHLQLQTDNMMSRMKEIKANMIDLIEDFIATTEQALEEKHDHLKRPIEKDIEKIEKALRNLENDIGGRHNRSTTRWAESLVQNVTEANDENGNLQRPIRSRSYSKLHDVLAMGIEELTYKMNKVGSFITEDSGSMLLQYDKHHIDVEEDRTTCDINDMCQLDDGSLLLCDWNNTKIKRLDEDLEVKDVCLLPSIPWAVCPTGPSEIAVSLFLLERIQFVTVTHDSITPASKFKVGTACRGIGYIDSSLIISCGGGGIGEGQGHLRIFNKAGDLLKVIKEDPHGHVIFSCPFHIAVQKDMLYITDRDDGLICLDMDLQNVVTTQTFGLPKGICTEDDTNLLICDFKNGSVLQYNTLTNENTVLIQQANKLTGPQSICYDHVNNKIVVASGNSNVIYTYQLIEANNEVH